MLYRILQYYGELVAVGNVVVEENYCAARNLKNNRPQNETGGVTS